MSSYLVNETLAVVEQEIDQFLIDFPRDHPYVMALSLPSFRQQLKAKILSTIPNRHKVRTDEDLEFTSVHGYTGVIEEKLVIEERILRAMPDMIDDLRYRVHQENSGEIIDQDTQTNSLYLNTDWWVRVHTIIPCVTYYFGPFTDQKEASTAYPGYLEDLRAEKAIGIFADIKRDCPRNLTLVDSPADLKQDQQRLWKIYKKIYRQKSILENSYHKLLELLPGNYLIVDCHGKIQDANQNACRLLNTNRESLRGKPFIYYAPQQQISLLENHLENIVKDQSEWQVPYCWSMQLQSLSSISISVDIQATQKRDDNGEINGFYWLLNDITSLATINDQLYYESHHDSLTCLPNRRSLALFLENLHQNVHAGDNYGDQVFALLMLDLNKFKSINDRFGHLFGDKVLQRVAEILLECVREGDQVARLSGDEFIIVLKSTQSGDDAKKCADRIHRLFSRPLTVEGIQLLVSTSIGVVISNYDQFDYERLIDYADTAMYEAKRNGNLFVVFDDTQPSANGKSHPSPIKNLSLEEGEGI
ncbi:diguanylate cyclase [Synechocystis sp. LEGE 06083]|uniref:diguanylate cyclase domain-containing protein n=1 Tax=Synechocystis sp. LEGE 06083 TaxID=915336 RepID=UPI00187FB6F5|nr:diguanylate cyclase [Synechocystis sp. LEGE 06083]MBE9194170.1 diguanylate cyclase [Synechocystis sp. LEGE 06083]